MRTKNFILILCCMLVTSLIYIILNPAGEPNDSFKSIVTQTHHQFNKLQENLRVAEQKKLEIDAKYLAILGFTTSDTTQVNQKQAPYFGYNIASDQRQQTQSQIPVDIDIHHLPLQPKNAASMQLQSTSEGPHVTTTPYNGTKANFTIVTYVQDGQAPSAILLSQNIAAKFPNEYLLIYDLGISEEESHSLTAYCNSSKCSVINYDLSVFPSHVTDQRMHAFRPIVIKDALMRSKSILFAENYIRIRGTSRDLYELQSKATSGVLGWSTPTAVSARTHPKMFDYFQTNADNFFFMRMVDMDTVFFSDSAFVTEKILLPWLKCALTVECIDPIGAQSNGCKYNKKPLYRYSGCHAYDASAFNIVLGLWHHDESKYSLPSEENKIFYKETLEQATKNLESRRRNSSETSEHPYPFTED